VEKILSKELIQLEWSIHKAIRKLGKGTYSGKVVADLNFHPFIQKPTTELDFLERKPSYTLEELQKAAGTIDPSTAFVHENPPPKTNPPRSQHTLKSDLWHPDDKIVSSNKKQTRPYEPPRIDVHPNYNDEIERVEQLQDEFNKEKNQSGRIFARSRERNPDIPKKKEDPLPEVNEEYSETLPKGG